ncbi:dimethylarginine dimethylaminohydrolase family protein [Rhodohalobacter mucosus]|uniref:Dimethylargininase n=1 Tax=Rhodohalobacter mucosus TaxID=2079485 RepID=A0A316TS69_9BACT|nr:arginine deiminase family protein [Rhodohalobacter mucosus]PWN07397.1 dimethylargininase [Rhodohalobacter mucosus]
MKSTALTRNVSPLLAECELTHLNRSPIDIAKAAEQHQAYEKALETMGYTILRLPDLPDHPDGVFVEDTAFVLPEIAIIARPGAESRRAETDSMASVLEAYRVLHPITSPGTLDGGDVLVLGKTIYIGSSGRTNHHAIQQVAEITRPIGYKVVAVPVTGCLHLKTAVSAIEEDLILMNPEWIDPAIFEGCRSIPVHPSEPFGANVMRKNNTALTPISFPGTAEVLQKLGYDLLTVDQSELAKAEAGLTCCSVIVPHLS